VEDHIIVQSESDALPSHDKYGNPLKVYDDLFWGMVRRGLAEHDRREEARRAAEATETRAAHQQDAA
jgi:hypothetical protein